ncbi:Lipid A 3-O-deacylase (PagL) [Noviherbaspirillum humi]|uniref:Lipid A deacylase n=1 Tax=Noviherbaspirillum humi TaxID=1688639 RepID=A0A239L9S9_9BURK|nr:acyloxyacyl hydrolase [Noviherbaspirillum humi]SNT27055.1 Lipid A 3-O-deacylase (PagL) [Noviherbaspirillum humi]
MSSIKKARLAFAGYAVLLTLYPVAASAVDSASLEFGTGNKTQMARLGVQWQWDKQWFKTNGMHLGGYWDLTLAQWRGNQFQGIRDNRQNITDIGITPVLRFQSDNRKGFYGELGIGAHYLSELYDNNGRRLSTRFEFGDHVGVGYVFSNNLDVALKFQHFSNGGIKSPNNGVNFGLIKVGYAF